ncbi:MAG: hypothetical protein ACK6EB_00585, partial [Planctomyces sp.]
MPFAVDPFDFDVRVSVNRDVLETVHDGFLARADFQIPICFARQDSCLRSARICQTINSRQKVRHQNGLQWLRLNDLRSLHPVNNP